MLTLNTLSFNLCRYWWVGRGVRHGSAKAVTGVRSPHPPPLTTWNYFLSFPDIPGPAHKTLPYVYTMYILIEVKEQELRMSVKIQKWGNSLGVRIPKAVIESESK